MATTSTTSWPAHRNGDLIVFLHPGFADHHSFRGQFDFFANRYRVLALDMIGHGRSQARRVPVTIDQTPEHVVEIMALENQRACHLVGVSMGSLIAQSLAARYPETVRSVTVVGGYSIFGDNITLERSQRKTMLKFVLLLLFSKERFRRAACEFVAITPAAREMFDQGAALFPRRSLRVMSGMRNIFHKDDKAVHYPLLIVVGQHESEILRTTAATWHEREPASELSIVSGAGHCANMDNAKEFNATLAQFLRQFG